MNIFIVTNGDLKNLTVLNQIPKTTKYQIILCVEERYLQLYLSPPQAFGYYFIHKEQSRPALNEAIAAYAAKMRDDKYLVCEENSIFFTRQNQNFAKSKPSDVEDLFDQISLYLDQFSFVGIADKAKAHLQPRDCVVNPEVGLIAAFNIEMANTDFCLITEWAVKNDSNFHTNTQSLP